MLSLVLIPSFFSSVSYNITGGFGAPSNTMSVKASNIMQAEFPALNSTDSSILIVIQNASVYSDSLKQSVLALNETLYKDPNVGNYTGEQSLYSLEASLLNESLPAIINQTAILQSNIVTTNSGLYTLQDNLTQFSTGLFQLQDGINQTAQLVYGVPAAFVGVWQGVSQQLTASGDTNPIDANMQANATTFSVTSNFGGNTQSIGYYTAFFNAWNASYQTLPITTSVSDRETFAINQSVTTMLSSQQLDAQTSQMIGVVASGLTVTTWNQSGALANLTMSIMASSIPSSIVSALGASPTSLVNQLYSFGSSPSNATLGNYAITLLEASESNITASDAGFSISALMDSAYQLGSSPNDTQTWNLACDSFSNATQSTFSDSPLFTINPASLTNILSGLSPNATTADVDVAISNLVAAQPYADFPYVPSTSLSDNFVNSQNNTMLVVLTFSSNPDANTIAHVQSEVANSSLQNFGSVYVTGGAVLVKMWKKPWFLHSK